MLFQKVETLTRRNVLSKSVNNTTFNPFKNERQVLELIKSVGKLKLDQTSMIFSDSSVIRLKQTSPRSG